MDQNAKDDIVVGSIYIGSTVVKIDEERSLRPNGMTRVRRCIHLASGMIVVEDKFVDDRPAIEGEYNELVYVNVPAPNLNINDPTDPKVNKEKRKPKKTKAPPPLDDELKHEKRKTESGKEDSEGEVQQKAEDDERKRAEEIELMKEAQERAVQKEQELRAKMEAEEMARRQEENRKQQEKEDAEREAERRRREAEENRLRASREALRQRKEETERRNAEERRKAAIVAKWKPKTLWVHSPKSKIQRTDHEDPATKDALPKAVWSYGSVTPPDVNFDRWKPHQVVVHPPGTPPATLDQPDTLPHGIWTYAQGVQLEKDEDDWFPKNGSECPVVILFPPGIPPSGIDGQELPAAGRWSYPAGDRTTFPPLPTPKNAWGPKRVTVHPKSKPPKDNDDKNQTRGLWMTHDGNETKPVGDENWRILDVMVYPEGKVPQDPSSTTPEPNGVWGLAPGARPDEKGDWSPSDLWFFGPGETTPDDEAWNPQGVWTYSPEDKRRDWPPVLEPQDEWEPRPVWIVPPSSLDKVNEEEWKPTGVWNFNTKEAADEAEDWSPCQVMVYPNGQEPADLENVKIRGVWGLVPSAVRDSDEDWKPSDMIFIGPGEKPPEDWRPQGIWTMSEPGSGGDDAEDWPPRRPSPNDGSSSPLRPFADHEMPKIITVHPKTKPPKDNDDDSHTRGLWMTHDGNETKPVGDENWRILDVMVYPEGKVPQDPSSTTPEPNGVWGLAPGARPDEKGEWSPSDLWFFGPGETTPDDEAWNPQGVWTYSPEDKRRVWPPVLEPQDEWEPRPVWIVPPSSLDKVNEEEWKPTGVWNFNTKEAADEAEDWSPCQVMVYPNGQEPADLENVKIRGVWGLVPSAVRDSDEDWKPSDMIFIGPGEKPPEDWRPQGIWTMSEPSSGGDDAEDWPPRRPLKAEQPGKAESSSTLPDNKSNAVPPRTALIFPKSKVPKEVEEGILKGVWSYAPGKKVMDSGKKPTLVYLYESGQELPNFPQGRGRWGYAPNAKPASDGHYLPCDTWFFAPSEKAPNDLEWQPQGTWSESPPVSTQEIDSPRKRADKAKKQKAKKELKRRLEKSVWVYPSKAKAPQKAEKKNPQGHWAHVSVSSEGDGPSEILIHTKGNEPKNMDKLPHGIFGYAPGSKPDEEGLWSPQDMIFFPPGEPPSPGIQNQGTWSCPHGSRVETTLSYTFEGNDIVNLKTTTIFYMDTSITFTKEFIE